MIFMVGVARGTAAGSRAYLNSLNEGDVLGEQRLAGNDVGWLGSGGDVIAAAGNDVREHLGVLVLQPGDDCDRRPARRSISDIMSLSDCLGRNSSIMSATHSKQPLISPAL